MPVAEFKDFKSLYNPKKDGDVNEYVIKIRRKKEFSNLSQIGLLSALSDAKDKDIVVYSIKRISKIKPIIAEFSVMRRRR